MKKPLHVTPRSSGGWQVKAAGSSRATVISPTKKAALNQSKRIAANRSVGVVIHGANGRIQGGIKK